MKQKQAFVNTISANPYNNTYYTGTTTQIKVADKPQYQNTGKHTTLGIELETRWQALNNLVIAANYTYRDPDNNNFRQVSEPEQDAYFRSDWSFLPFVGEIIIIFMGAFIFIASHKISNKI